MEPTSPIRGQPRLELFRDWWAGRCPGMLKLTTETRNNRHISTGERTPAERQYLSATVALEATLAHLTPAEL